MREKIIEGFKWFINGFLISLVAGLIAFALLKITDVNSNEPEHFEYREHSYIRFGNHGVVHDPDCQYCLDFFD